MTGAHAWNEQLDLGHEAMDNEHHLQVALVSAVADAIEQGRPAAAAGWHLSSWPTAGCTSAARSS